jgi:hypothetical protein
MANKPISGSLDVLTSRITNESLAKLTNKSMSEFLADKITNGLSSGLFDKYFSTRGREIVVLN